MDGGRIRRGRGWSSGNSLTLDTTVYTGQVRTNDLNLGIFLRPSVCAMQVSTMTWREIYFESGEFGMSGVNHNICNYIIFKAYRKSHRALLRTRGQDIKYRINYVYKHIFRARWNANLRHKWGRRKETETEWDQNADSTGMGQKRGGA